MKHPKFASKTSRLSSFLLTLLLVFTCTLSAQNDDVQTKFENYTVLPRETSYAHLNKSTLIKGEMLGYSVYVFDKFDKAPSTGTTNMYCVISDAANKIIKKKLIWMKDGVSHNVFNIDSTFTSGTYKFSAYTNYMLNFDETNQFETEFRVIDPEVEKEISKKSYTTNYTIQVLPEGGHLIADVQNTVAVIVKDNKGLGLKNLTGQIIDSDSTVVSDFKLDASGIAKTILFPKKKKSYKIIIPNGAEGELSHKVEDAEIYGFNMSLSELRETIILTFRTNEVTLPTISNENYKLTIHNGSKIMTSALKFENQKEISTVIKKDMLFPGINVLTVFDAQNKPILERLYFNHDGVSIANFDVQESIKKTNDSLSIKLKLNTGIDTSKIQNISLSILPAETKSYNFNTTILSKLYLEPYLKGYIENAQYYFSNTSAKVRYDLDNLLLSQGWSSYDWKTVFNAPPMVSHPFEFGITTVANVNDKDKSGTYVSTSLKNNTTEIFALSDSDTAFNQKGLFPMEDETYKVSKSNAEQSAKKPNLYVTFHPSDFPKNTLRTTTTTLRDDNSIAFISNNYPITNSSWNANGVEKLDEVVITANKEKTKIEEIESKYFGNVDVISDRTRESAMTMAMYLLSKGFNARESLGQLSITVRNPATPNNNIPVVYLDGTLLSDFNVLANFRMSTVDYVVIDKMGAAEGVRGVNGVIRIFTSPELGKSYKKNDLVSEHKFPLTFSESKKYYTPNYQAYNTAFYNDYGTIAWLPNLKVDSEGYISFKVYNTGANAFNLYIEGVANDKTFISETKTIKIN